MNEDNLVASSIIIGVIITYFLLIYSAYAFSKQKDKENKSKNSIISRYQKLETPITFQITLIIDSDNIKSFFAKNLKSNSNFCPYCGEEKENNNEICRYCNHQIINEYSRRRSYKNG